MKFTVLGSGGALRIPRACCSCPVCREARLKGFPYKRLGQSLFLHEGCVLFDTPEDINEELNLHGIVDVLRIFYSHWHPDHTLGCRIIETLMDDNADKAPILVHMPPERISITLNDNSIFPYFEELGYCKTNTDTTVSLNNISVRRIPLQNGFASAFMITQAEKRVLYCPCHAMYLPVSEELFHADLAILGLGYVNYSADGMTSFSRDILPLIDKIKPLRVVFTHIEETDGLGFEDFQRMQQEYENLQFAYDGMRITV